MRASVLQSDLLPAKRKHLRLYELPRQLHVDLQPGSVPIVLLLRGLARSFRPELFQSGVLTRALKHEYHELDGGLVSGRGCRRGTASLQSLRSVDDWRGQPNA